MTMCLVLIEYSICHIDVYASVAQLASAPVSKTGGCGFESHRACSPTPSVYTLGVIFTLLSMALYEFTWSNEGERCELRTSCPTIGDFLGMSHHYRNLAL